MEPWSIELACRLEEHTFDSTVLRNNALSDPHRRPLWVYLPPDYDDEAERREVVRVGPLGLLEVVQHLGAAVGTEE